MSMRLWLTATLTFATLGMCLAKATLAPPPAGEYYCTTASITVGTGPSVNPAGIAPLATQVLPSPLGVLVLDGKGGYRFPRLKSRTGEFPVGSYRFDAKTGKFAFTSGVFKGQEVTYSVDIFDGKNPTYRIVIVLEKNQGTHSCAQTIKAPAAPKKTTP